MNNTEENKTIEIESANGNQTVNDWSKVADSLIKTLEHNSDSILDISKEVAAIKTLAPDDIYSQMFMQIFQDEKMTTQEKIDQALRILRQRMEDQKDSAQIVEDLQRKKTEDAGNISNSHSDLITCVVGGLTFCFIAFTPIGREFLRSGLLSLKQAKLN